jgi:phospholipase C
LLKYRCSGVIPIMRYLESLPYPAAPNCEAARYYMLNNTNPGFLPNGAVDNKDIAAGISIPPSSARTIGDALNEKGISWAYYGALTTLPSTSPTARRTYWT